MCSCAGSCNRWWTGLKPSWTDILLEVTRLPLQLVLMTLVLDIADDQLPFLPESWDASIEDGFFVAYVVIIFFLFLWRLISSLAERYGKEAAELTETDLDEQLLPFFRRIGLLGLLVIMLIIVLGHFEVEVSGLVATLGVRLAGDRFGGASCIGRHYQRIPDHGGPTLSDWRPDRDSRTRHLGGWMSVCAAPWCGLEITGW